VALREDAPNEETQGLTRPTVSLRLHRAFANIYIYYIYIYIYIYIFVTREQNEYLECEYMTRYVK